MPERKERELSKINENNRDAVLDWLRDRSRFHTWLTTLILGSFIVLIVFGNRPGFDDIGAVSQTVSLVLLLISVLCNLVCVWSIPSWKYKVKTGSLKDARGMRLELAFIAWVGVISFICGLTLVFIGYLPG